MGTVFKRCPSLYVLPPSYRKLAMIDKTLETTTRCRATEELTTTLGHSVQHQFHSSTLVHYPQSLAQYVEATSLWPHAATVSAIFAPA